MHRLAVYPCLKLYAYNIRRRLDVLSVLVGWMVVSSLSTDSNHASILGTPCNQDTG